jgi:hypothetical protein
MIGIMTGGLRKNSAKGFGKENVTSNGQSMALWQKMHKSLRKGDQGLRRAWRLECRRPSATDGQFSLPVVIGGSGAGTRHC